MLHCDPPAPWFGAKESSRRRRREGRGDGKPTEVNCFAAARLGNFRFADCPGLICLSFCFGLRLRLPSLHFLCIIEYELGNREAQWHALKAKTNEMRSSTPRPAYLRSAVLPLPQRQRYQNKLASPRELCLRISRPRMISSMPFTGGSSWNSRT